jgi:hypothetical protein
MTHGVFKNIKLAPGPFFVKYWFCRFPAGETLWNPTQKNLILAGYPYSLCSEFWLKIKRGTHEKSQTQRHDMDTLIRDMNRAIAEAD